MRKFTHKVSLGNAKSKTISDVKLFERIREIADMPPIECYLLDPVIQFYISPSQIVNSISNHAYILESDDRGCNQRSCIYSSVDNHAKPFILEKSDPNVFDRVYVSSYFVDDNTNFKLKRNPSYFNAIVHTRRKNYSFKYNNTDWIMKTSEVWKYPVWINNRLFYHEPVYSVDLETTSTHWQDVFAIVKQMLPYSYRKLNFKSNDDF